MAGLPKKYAKMGFKKGWTAFKRSKKTKRSSPTRSRKKTSKRRVSFTMAKRRKKRSSSRGMKTTTKLMLGGAGYGLVREPVNQLMKKVPFVGGFGDEVALLGLSLLAHSRLRGVFKDVARAGIVIESHNLARNLSGGVLGFFGSQATAAPPAQTGQSFR